MAYAQELGYDMAPIAAWVRNENGRYLDNRYGRLRDAYLATTAGLGVAADLSPPEFVEAMGGYRQREPQMAIVVSAVKATVKDGIGKLCERPRGATAGAPASRGGPCPVPPGARTSVPP